jgi:hypothetical protein
MRSWVNVNTASDHDDTSNTNHRRPYQRILFKDLDDKANTNHWRPYQNIVFKDLQQFFYHFIK